MDDRGLLLALGLALVPPPQVTPTSMNATNARVLGARSLDKLAH
jgi:hypothetical protein